MAETLENPIERRDSTVIAPSVLVTIVRLTALREAGVAGMAPVPGGVNRLFRRGIGDGVRIELRDGRVAADLYLTLAPDTNVRQVSRAVQAAVARALEEMAGMTAERVDVHVEDIDYGAPPARNA